MICKISCSFGEIIDKITILKIKLSKAKERKTIENIKKELDTITQETPLSKNNDELFEQLQKINKKLWILEDLIREKSKNKSFDEKYIEFAEQIHKFNDERYNIKKKINLKYNSTLIEEKIYKDNPNIKSIINDELTNEQLINDQLIITEIIDNENLNEAKLAYTNGEYKKSYEILNSLMEKLCDYEYYNNFYVDLIFAYENITNIYNYKNKYYYKLDQIMEIIDELDIMDELKEYCKSQYTTNCLNMLNYKKAFKYINIINHITGPNVSYKNMSFFKKDDTNKTLLIYDGGGLGDKFMFSRFIPKLCNDYCNNKIIFFVNDNIAWIFNDIFKKYNNLNIVTYELHYLMGPFDYHCSLMYLMKCFNIEYNNIYFEPLLENMKIEITENNKSIINDIKNNKNKTYIFNWKGNPKCGHEKSNRRMDLKHAIPLFNLKNITFIVVTKDVTPEEKRILLENNVKYIGDQIDNNENCFQDTIGIFKNVDGIISTDTSLVHLAANLNLNTYVMLTTGCEWRWTTDINTTNWYPSLNLLRQKNQGNWESVIEELITQLNS
tara:strand:- start:712 stop:2370 length:1659 start_codon:yes stop_codon:yes gene_type:complete